MNRGVLDTSVLVAAGVAPIPGELAVSVASIAELQFGVLIARTSEARAIRLARLSAIQRRFDPLPIDGAVADSYARLAARVVEIGRQPRSRTMDLLIAATAHAHGASVYTRNAADLTGLEDLVRIVAI
ncbi:type II toxin-antitoxin system VapC family toxin [Frankia tisae]|uniref:type II toxin-antitoxin system VapC family toxin n=1 Tax=Frankia tisae TaxID=2950104 RepID=UPI0021C211A8|nr:type II toxin-antitoxin system VapC family toxin [Frankia tisae]